MYKNIFEIIFYKGNETTLEFRLKQNSKNVSKFIIFSKDVYSSQLIKKYENNPKIKIIVETEPLENTKLYSSIIRKEISTLFEDFDDIVSISCDEEIPNFELVDLENLPSPSINFLYHTVYEYSFDSKRKYLEQSTGICTFSHVLQQKNFLEYWFNSKNKNIKFISDFEQGIILKNFNNEKQLEKTYLCPFSNSIVPFIISNQNQKKSDEILILFDCDLSTEFDEYNLILNVKTSEKFPEKLEINLQEKVQNFNIFVPNENLYESNNFRKTYLINEIERILSLISYYNFDKIDFKFDDSEIQSYYK